MSWRADCLAHEGARNVLRGGFRTLLVLGSIVIGVSVTVIAVGSQVDGFMVDEASLAGEGGFVLRALPGSNSPDGIDSARCENLRSQDGVVAAGSVVTSDFIELASFPGTRIRKVDVSPGLSGVFHLGIDPGAMGVFVDSSLREEFGLGVGSVPGVVDAPGGEESFPVVGVLTSTQGVEELRRALVAVVPPEGPGEACFVLARPDRYEALRDADLVALLPVDNSIALVSEVVPRGSGFSIGDRYRSRRTRHLWIVFGMMIVAVSELVRRTRRSELALYRSVGTSPVELTWLLIVENLWLSFLALPVIAGVLVIWVAVNHPFRASLAHGLHDGALILVVVVAQLPLMAAVAASRSVMDGLKDR